jgi:uncharacterized protein (DUF302 family)
MAPVPTPYTLAVRLPGDPAALRPRVQSLLSEQGFGVLTEIDVQATLKAKLGVDGPAYLILGACNPPLAHRALEADPSVGALLPCNVVLRQEGDSTVVEVMDPRAVLNLSPVPELAPLVHEATERLLRVLAALEARPEGEG